MTTADARQHQIPEGSNAIDIEAIVATLSASIRSIASVADAAGLATFLSNLTAASIPASATNPAYVHQQDAPGGRYLKVNDGTNTFQFGPIGTATPYAISMGVVTVNIASGATSGTAAVTFPAGRFSVAPILELTVGETGYSPYFTGLTSTGVTVGLRHVDNATTTGLSRVVHWTAKQMLSGTAEG